MTRPIPHEAPLVFGDMLHNLRSAFDGLVFALSGVGESAPLTSEQARIPQFPITKCETDWNRDSPRRLQFVSTQVRTLIHDLQPYRDSGDDDGVRPLQQLDDLSNVDKHRRLHVLAREIHGTVLSLSTPLVPKMVWPPEGPLHDGDEICRYVFDSPTDVGPDAFKPIFALCLDETSDTGAVELADLGQRLCASVRSRVFPHSSRSSRRGRAGISNGCRTAGTVEARDSCAQARDPQARSLRVSRRSTGAVWPDRSAARRALPWHDASGTV